MNRSEPSAEGDSLFSSTEMNSVCGFHSGNASFPEPFRNYEILKLHFMKEARVHDYMERAAGNVPA